MRLWHVRAGRATAFIGRWQIDQCQTMSLFERIGILCKRVMQFGARLHVVWGSSLSCPQHPFPDIQQTGWLIVWYMVTMLLWLRVRSQLFLPYWFHLRDDTWSFNSAMDHSPVIKDRPDMDDPKLQLATSDGLFLVPTDLFFNLAFTCHCAIFILQLLSTRWVPLSESRESLHRAVMTWSSAHQTERDQFPESLAKSFPRLFCNYASLSWHLRIPINLSLAVQVVPNYS